MQRWWSLAACAMLVLLGATAHGGLIHDTGGPHAVAAADLRDWIRARHIDNPGAPGHGAVTVHADPGHDGNGSRWHHVVPYFAHQGLLGYVRSTATDRFDVTWDYVTWYLGHNVSGDRRVLNHWYADNGTLQQTCPPGVAPGDPQNKCHYEDATDSYAATFLTLLGAYHHEGGNASRFHDPGVRGAVEDIADLLLSLMDPADNLTWNRPSGERTKYLLDNAEVFEGLSAMAYLEDHVYEDAARTARYADNATAVRDAIRSELFVPVPTGGHAYAVGKAENATAAQPPDPTLWYWSGPQQLWPIMTGVTDPTDAQATAALAYLETVWGPGPRNWTHNTVDHLGQLWAGAGYAAHAAGLESHARTHAEYLLCRTGDGWPVEPAFAWPFHVGDAGFLLQSLDAGLALPDGTLVCPPHGAGAWLPAP